MVRPETSATTSIVLGTNYVPGGFAQGQPLRQSAIAARPLSAQGFLLRFFVLLTICFGLVWVYVATMPMAFLSRDYPLLQAKRRMLDTCQLGSVAVFGDSRAVAAVMPRVIPVATSNFALSGTSPIETYFLVRRALRCSKLPKMVVIAHSVFKYASDSDYWVFDAPTGFLKLSDMRAIDRDAARLHDREIERLQPDKQIPMSLRELLYPIRFPPLYFANLVNGYVAARWRHNWDAYNDALKSSGHAFFGTAPGSDDVVSEAEDRVYHTSPLIDLYFTRTLALLARYRIPVYVMTVPINRATAQRMPATLPAAFSTYLDEKAQQFSNLHIVNPIIPCWPDRYYGDGWHFNAAGAEQYSREFGKWLTRVMAGDAAQWNQNRCGDAASPASGAKSINLAN